MRQIHNTAANIIPFGAYGDDPHVAGGNTLAIHQHHLVQSIAAEHIATSGDGIGRWIMQEAGCLGQRGVVPGSDHRQGHRERAVGESIVAPDPLTVFDRDAINIGYGEDGAFANCLSQYNRVQSFAGTGNIETGDIKRLAGGA